jgi:1-deoxy-D-xylulose-5-phosphate reductoisomerase
MKKTIIILGSTGSIGKNTVKLISQDLDNFAVEALTANDNYILLADQAIKLGAKKVVIGEEKYYNDLKKLLQNHDIEVLAGKDAIAEIVKIKVDLVMAAIVGAASLVPVYNAVVAGNNVGLASKEALVCAGHIITNMAKKTGAKIIPVDSEHNAIYQIFDFDKIDSINKIILTASGGPFLNYSFEELQVVTPQQAVAHPNWNMGQKISVDSASMMNKALEVIEAHHIFAMTSDKIDVVIHPQSIIHSMVEYSDGSILAQMGSADMQTPISYSLYYPNRSMKAPAPFSFNNNISLEFLPYDAKRFPSINIAKQSIDANDASSIIMNAANEVAVARFLQNEISFLNIYDVINQAMATINYPLPSNIDEVIAIDIETRKFAQDLLFF